MLSNLKSPKTIKKSVRRGRGYGSGRGGHTTGRGQKGQKSRAGYKKPRPDFEGGAMPLSRRLPKLKGFSRKGLQKKTSSYIINLDDLNKFDNKTEVDIKKLEEAGIISGSMHNKSVKVLGTGKLDKEVNLVGIKVSKTAKLEIEKNKGTIK